MCHTFVFTGGAFLSVKTSDCVCVQDWYNALLHNVDGEDSSVWLSAAPTSRIQASMRRLLARYHNDALSDFMNGSVRKRVGIIPDHVSWGGQSAKVLPFKALIIFMECMQSCSNFL